MKIYFTTYILALVLLVSSYTLAGNSVTHSNQVGSFLSFQPDFAIKPSIVCDKPFERPANMYRGDNPIGSHDIIESASGIYPPISLVPQSSQPPIVQNPNSGYPYENIAHEFEINLFGHLSDEAYQKAHIYFDALKNLLDDEVLLRQKGFAGLNSRQSNISINSSVTFFLPSNTFFQTYIEELGFVNMNDFRVRDPRGFRELILSYTAQGVYPIESLFYFYEKSGKPLRTNTGIRIEVGDNCTDVFINGVKIIDTDVAIYDPDYAGFFFVHFLEEPLIPTLDRELVKHLQ